MDAIIRVEPQVRINVHDINPGGRKTILFIHGWPANHKMFEYQYNALVPLGYRCIGMDMRGFGKSDKPLSGYTYNRLADDIRCVIEAMGLRDITLLGHSTGGAVAIRYMSRHNGHGVAKLALLASAAPSLIQRPYFPYGQTTETIEQIIDSTLKDRPQMLADFGKLFFYHQVSDPFAEWFNQLGLEAASWSTVAVSKAWLAEELFYDLPRVLVPTLILHGVHDQVCLYPLALAQHQGIARSQLVTFEDSGHGLFYDEMEKCNRELAQFIG